MDSPVPSLFRYYMCMSLARQEFENFLPESLKADDPEQPAQAGMTFMFTKAGLMMQVWYGMLFVVVEGWQQSGLTDPEIEQLLTNSDYVAKLRTSATRCSITRDNFYR